MKNNPITQEPWEKEFDELFVSTNTGSATGLWWKIPSKVGVKEKADPKAVKAFISKWLQQERKNVINELTRDLPTEAKSGWKDLEYTTAEADAYNLCLKHVRELFEEHKQT